MRKSVLIALAVALSTARRVYSEAAPPAVPQQTPPVQAGAPGAPGQGQPGAPGPGQMARPQRPPAPPPYDCEPVNPNATPEARALLKTLCAVSGKGRSEEHTSELQSLRHLVCRLL